jgi:16S rRNA (guanine1207-N2)-methyltransferase
MHVQPVGRLLQKNADRIDGSGTLLVINPPTDIPLSAMAGKWRRIRLFTQEFGHWRRLRDAREQADFGVVPQPGAQVPGGIVLVLPREKERLRMLLHWGAAVLGPAGSLWVAGENRAGARSAGRQLEAYFGQVEKVDSARHCTLYRARSPLPAKAFELPSYYSEWSCNAGPLRLRLSALPGVFARGRIDPGTALLLGTLPEPGAIRSVLDFGCGCGILGIALRCLIPGASAVLLDGSALAVASAHRSLGLNGLEAAVLASDGFSEVTGRFDLIVSNPPFHEGHRTRPDMSTHLLAPVRNFLNPGGQLMLVTNRHLPYRRWLDETFGGHEVLATDSRFQVLRAVQSRNP